MIYVRSASFHFRQYNRFAATGIPRRSRPTRWPAAISPDNSLLRLVFACGNIQTFVLAPTATLEEVAAIFDDFHPGFHGDFCGNFGRDFCGRPVAIYLRLPG